MIILEPYAGLANRLRAIDSAIILSNETGLPLKIEWVVNHDLNCSFNELFYPIENVQICDSKKIFWPFSKYYRLHLLYKKLCFKKSLTSRLEFKQFADDLEYRNMVLASNKIFIASCDSFYGNSANYNYLKPKSEISAQVDKTASLFSTQTIGIHIRRTDHAKSIEGSKTEMFIDVMNKELSLNQNVNFFLSTDSPAEEKKLRDVFGEKIISCEKDFVRSNKKGIKDALVDMLCLSKTRKIYGSHMSSFSGAASYFGQIEVRYITERFKF
ncbi:MAG: hypothetical protein IPO21_01860 [Bacteroidales bacterium]|nr:hypothetical protein [Bacteroidales bacterium]